AGCVAVLRGLGRLARRGAKLPAKIGCEAVEGENTDSQCQVEVGEHDAPPHSDGCVQLLCCHRRYSKNRCQTPTSSGTSVSAPTITSQLMNRTTPCSTRTRSRTGCSGFSRSTCKRSE